MNEQRIHAIVGLRANLRAQAKRPPEITADMLVQIHGSLEAIMTALLELLDPGIDHSWK